ncbi:hypothetical protein [Ekhidna sp.]|uniref:hypothetical protein n=1 Tax=Ekhidna sp. TaxID=2608089 RepID=UPI0032ED3986
MRNKLITTFLFILAVSGVASGQRIVVDSTSTSKYLIAAKKSIAPPKQDEEPTFSDRAVSIGLGILNRLKARLNLEEAAESIKDKKEEILGKPEEEDGG